MDHPGLPQQAADFEVGLYKSHCVDGTFHEGGMLRSSGQRLDAERPGAGEQV